MKIRLLLLIFVITISSCVSTRLDPDNYQKILDKKDQRAFITFRSTFKAGQSPAKGWKLRVMVVKKGKNGFMADFKNDSQTFLYHLPPGKYEIKRFEYVSTDGNTRIGFLPVNRSIDLKPGIIHYLGDLELQRITWSSNAGPMVIAPFSYVQGGMELQQLSKKLAAGWSFQWVDNFSMAVSNIQEGYPGLNSLEWTNIILITQSSSTNEDQE